MNTKRDNLSTSETNQQGNQILEKSSDSSVDHYCDEELPSAITFFVDKLLERMNLKDEEKMHQDLQEKHIQIKQIPDAQIQKDLLRSLISRYKEKILIVEQIFGLSKQLKSKNCNKQHIEDLSSLLFSQTEISSNEVLEYFKMLLEKLNKTRDNIVRKHTQSQEDQEGRRQKGAELLEQTIQVDDELIQIHNERSVNPNSNKKCVIC